MLKKVSVSYVCFIATVYSFITTSSLFLLNTETIKAENEKYYIPKDTFPLPLTVNAKVDTFHYKPWTCGAGYAAPHKPDSFILVIQDSVSKKLYRDKVYMYQFYYKENRLEFLDKHGKKVPIKLWVKP